MGCLFDQARHGRVSVDSPNRNEREKTGQNSQYHSDRQRTKNDVDEKVSKTEGASVLERVFIEVPLTQQRPDLNFGVHEEWRGERVVDVGREVHFDQVEPEQAIHKNAGTEMETVNWKATDEDARPNG